MSVNLSLPEYSAYTILVSDDCGPKGNGSCDGHDYESNESCGCPCHEAETLPETTEGVTQWHTEMHKTQGASV